MPSASALRLQIEHTLERRFPGALSPVPRTIRETSTTSIHEVDRLLDGGLPVGAISEITGPVSSGRTSLALAFLAMRTLQENVCAWIDASDAFDAESAAANGVVLRQLLWVRCNSANPKTRFGTRPDFSNLDQALRATDLLLQVGGFSALVLDLGSTAPEYSTRIPLATWFRFRHAAARTRCSLLVLAQKPVAQSSADLVLECALELAESPGNAVLAGCSYQVRTVRVTTPPSTISIAGKRKPPVSVWSAAATAHREASA